MENYSALLDQILQVPALAKQVERFAADHDAVNLVTKDWKKILENHTVFQEFQHNASRMFQSEYLSYNRLFRVQQLQDPDKPLKVIVAGYCNMYKPYDQDGRNQSVSLTVKDSPVMNMILKAMTSDLDDKLVRLKESCKLNFKSCSLICQYCANARKSMVANRISVNFKYRQPCIADILVYNGKTLANRFGCQVLDSFSGEFIAIVKMELHTRFFFGHKDTKEKNVAVSGSVSKMVCFPESNLKEAQVDLGDLSALAEAEEAVPNTSPGEMSDSGRKRPLECDDAEEEDEEEEEVEDILGILPLEKKQKTWQDEFDVSEDTILL